MNTKNNLPLIKKENVIEFKFITKYDLYSTKWIHWSRKYEYPITIDYIKKNRPKSIHNTSCGGLNSKDCLHLTFCEEISELCDNTIHSDIWETHGAPKKPSNGNFKFYDITKSYEPNNKFDMVINLSTLEELNNKDRNLAFVNLYNQVNDGGTLFLTLDYPDVDIKWIENIVGKKVKSNYWKRIYNRKKKLSVILLIITKQDR